MKQSQANARGHFCCRRFPREVAAYSERPCLVLSSQPLPQTIESGRCQFQEKAERKGTRRCSHTVPAENAENAGHRPTGCVGSAGPRSLIPSKTLHQGQVCRHSAEHDGPQPRGWGTGARGSASCGKHRHGRPSRPLPWGCRLSPSKRQGSWHRAGAGGECIPTDWQRKQREGV